MGAGTIRFLFWIISWVKRLYPRGERDVKPFSLFTKHFMAQQQLERLASSVALGSRHSKRVGMHAIAAHYVAETCPS